jgi:hypothetical protein
MGFKISQLPAYKKSSKKLPVKPAVPLFKKDVFKYDFLTLTSLSRLNIIVCPALNYLEQKNAMK